MLYMYILLIKNNVVCVFSVQPFRSLERSSITFPPEQEGGEVITDNIIVNNITLCIYSYIRKIIICIILLQHHSTSTYYSCYY